MFFSNVRKGLNDKYLLLVSIICLALVIFKSSYFSLPYFSDELWVYGPSIRKMGSQIPSMLPSSLSFEDHWGHPLLFFFLGGIWTFLFGTSILSTHLFATFLSLLLLLVIYFTLKNIFSNKIAFYSVLLLSFQGIFLGQFNLVLPEILLTLFLFLTVFFYLNNKYLLYIVSGASLVLVKETGVLFIVTIILWNVIRYVLYEKEKIFLWKFFKENLLLSVPLLFIALHTFVLYLTYGWFVAPNRLDDFNFTWDSYYDRIMKSFHYVFIDQGRKPITITFFLVCVLLQRKYVLWKRIFFLVFIFALYKVFFNYWKLPFWITVSIVPLLFLYCLKLFTWDIYNENKKLGSWLGISTLFIIIYLLFSSSQFDSLRYLFCIIPLLIIITLYFIENNIQILNKYKLIIISGVFTFFLINYLINDKNFGDDTLNYKEVCIANKEAVEYLEKGNFYDNQVIAPFLFQHTLERPLTGYLSSEKIFTNVNKSNKLDSNVIYVFNNITYNKKREEIINDSNFKLIFKKESKLIWFEIYQKTH